MTQSAYSNKPLPRLKHIQPGQFLPFAMTPRLGFCCTNPSITVISITDMHPSAMSSISGVWCGVRTDGKQEHELQLH